MRKQTKVLLIILASIIVLAGVLILSINVFSRQIGDFYKSRQNTDEAFRWYEINYKFYHSEEGFNVLIESLLVVDDRYQEKIKYYSVALETKPEGMSKLIYEFVYIDYLETLYHADQIDEFKSQFEINCGLFEGSENYLSLFAPFKLIFLDSEVSDDTLNWSIAMIETLIDKYQMNDMKYVGYRFEAIFYERLGDDEKASEYNLLSDLYK